MPKIEKKIFIDCNNCPLFVIFCQFVKTPFEKISRLSGFFRIGCLFKIGIRMFQSHDHISKFLVFMYISLFSIFFRLLVSWWREVYSFWDI